MRSCHFNAKIIHKFAQLGKSGDAKKHFESHCEGLGDAFEKGSPLPVDCPPCMPTPTPDELASKHGVAVAAIATS